MMRLALALLLVCGTVQAQLMNRDKEAVWRSYVPKIDDNPVIAQKIAQAILYTDAEIPPAYQFQELSGGYGTQHTQFYSTAHRHNQIDKYTHANLEFPWADPGGLNHVDPTKVTEVRFIWLPPRDDGAVWPVVLFRGALQKSRSVNMPVPTQGYRWLFPRDAMVGEVLLKKFSDGSWAPYEMRIRLREINAWEVEVYRPFENIEQLAKVLPQGMEAFKFSGVWEAAMIDTFHPTESAFSRSGANMILPRIDNARELLMKTPFKPVGGSVFTRTASYQVEAVTAEDDDNIVPAHYNSAYLGTTAETCANCHQHVLKHADAFDAGRDWYGYVRGSDGIFSFHPIAPDAIRPYGSGRTRIRDEFARSGVVEMYDANRHPSDIYQRIPSYDNPPLKNPPRGNTVMVGGYR